MHTTKIGILRQYLASSHAANAATASCLINAIDGRYLAIDRCLLELVLSTDGGPSSGVSQTVTVQVCLRHRKPRTSEYAEEKTREHNLIYAAVNLTREYN